MSIKNLKLSSCPHCSISNPNLESEIQPFSTSDRSERNFRKWNVFVCTSCGGVITACSKSREGKVSSIYPDNLVVDSRLPQNAQDFLQQAIDSTSTPIGSIMLSAKAIDVMLKEIGLKYTSLQAGILKAVKKKLIPYDMEIWASQTIMELSENDNFEDSQKFPIIKDAKQTLEFTLLLAEYLYVMPEKVRSGVESSMPVLVE